MNFEQIKEKQKRCGMVIDFCPRCGKVLYKAIGTLVLSRYVDLYICPECGVDEAIASAYGKDTLPLDKWYYTKIDYDSSIAEDIQEMADKLTGNWKYEKYTKPEFLELDEIEMAVIATDYSDYCISESEKGNKVVSIHDFCEKKSTMLFTRNLPAIKIGQSVYVIQGRYDSPVKSTVENIIETVKSDNGNIEIWGGVEVIERDCKNEDYFEIGTIYLSNERWI